jgi:LAS superfamily LD-carboxypeptidase LdcB
MQLDKTVSNIQSGAARVNQLYAFRKQQQAVAHQKAQQGAQPDYGSSPAPSAGGAGQLSNPAGLTRYGTGYLATNAAKNLQALNSAYHAATGGNISLTEGWRSLSKQQQLYALYRAGKGNLAATPGSSVHGTGRAADLGGIGGIGTGQFNWMVQNASKFRWSWTGRNFSQVEPWHWEYVGG